MRIRMERTREVENLQEMERTREVENFHTDDIEKLMYQMLFADDEATNI